MKVSIIGAGNVGAQAALEIARLNICEQIVLVDIKPDLAEGKAIDIEQSKTLLGFDTVVTGVTNDYMASLGSDVIVITSGVPRKPGMTREDLVEVNSKVVSSVFTEVARWSPEAVFIVVSNPLDSMVYLCNKLGLVKSSQIIGMGNLLDTCRFKYHLSKVFQMNPNDVGGLVLGGHGDKTMYPQVESVTEELQNQSEMDAIIEATQAGGATLTSKLGTSAWVTPGVCIAYTVKQILLNTHKVLPCSVYHEEYDCAVGTLVALRKVGFYKQSLLNKSQFKAIEEIKKTNAIVDKFLVS